jgi:hypothetical protein
MLSEGRKRDAAANALLSLSFAANAAQSPESLVTSGKAAAPSLPLMGELMRKRKEANRNLDSPRVSEPARNRKKKTFKEFVEESYLIERGQPTFSSREELERHYGGIPSGKIANNASSAEKPKWRLVNAENRKGQSERNKERKMDLTSPEDMRQGEIKAKKLRKAGLDAHHITPLHYSAKLKASMSPSEWADRVKRDASNGIYHGHHHKNLMGAVTDRTPESRSKRGIRHRAGGAHELEAKARDIEHVGHKGLLAAAHKRRLRKEREEKQNN